MSAIVATLLAIGLLAVLAARHFDGLRAAAITAAWCLSMPVVWAAMREDSPHAILLPFVAAWLLAVDQYARSQAMRWLALAGATLAVMLYVHRAALVMAPALVGLTAAILLMTERHRWRAVSALIGGAAVMAAPWLLNWWRDPALFNDVVQHYRLYDASQLNVLQGLREISSWTSLTVRVEVYWDALNPALLFLDGVMLLLMAPVLIRGLLAYVINPRGLVDLAVIAAFVAAPLVVAVVGQRPVAARLLLLMPAAALMATRGCYPGAFRTMVAGSPVTPAILATTR